MDKQAIFDKTWDWFVVQKNGPSIAYNTKQYTSCMYRGEKGMRCAIGLHIPDELYMERYRFLEGKGIHDWPEEDRQSLFGSDYNIHFLDYLQGCHDDSTHSGNPDNYMQRFLEEIEARMRKLAANYDLTIPDHEEAATQD